MSIHILCYPILLYFKSQSSVLSLVFQLHFLFVPSRDDGTLSIAIELLSAHLLPWLQTAKSSSAEGDSVSLLIKTNLQFIGNACVGHVQGQTVVWQLCFPELFRSALCR